MKWITRERPKIDLIACPWLIKRFIDENAEIMYAPFDQVLKQAIFKRIAKIKSVKAFVDGITAAVVGALMGSVLVISFRSIKDLPTLLIALSSLLALIYIKKIKEPLIILIAALIGIILKIVL